MAAAGGAAAARRRPLALPARADRLRRRRRRRSRRRQPMRRRAWQRFRGLLAELVAELPLLRDLSSPGARCRRSGEPVARRMVAACRPSPAHRLFITAMAAVAGSVAEELIASFASRRHRARLRQQRRRHRPAPRTGRRVRARHLTRRDTPRPRWPLRGRRGLAGARHRHLGLARAQLLARHRRQRHGARRRRRGRRCGGDDHRQRRRRRATPGIVRRPAVRGRRQRPRLAS